MLNAHKVAQQKDREGNIEYRTRDNERRRNARKNMTENEKEKERQRDCERKRRKMVKNEAGASNVSTPQNIGKAIASVERALPASDTTKKVVISKLYEKYSALPQPDITSPSTSQCKYASAV